VGEGEPQGQENALSEYAEEMNNDPVMGWFYKRFGYSTWEIANKVKADSFSPEEYDRLISISLAGNEAAVLALAYSAYTHLKDQPNDPAFQKYKERLYNRGWLMNLMEKNYAAACVVQFLPVSLLNDRELVKASLRYGRGFESLPESFYSDRKFVEELLDSEQGAYFPIHKLPPEFLDDKKIAIKASTAQVYQYKNLSEKIRNDKDVQCAAWAAIQKTQEDPTYKAQMMTSVGLPSEIGGKAIDDVCGR
jgi:hypothetical protein